MNKKILSVVLILCVMLAVMPMTAYAADIAFCTKCNKIQTVRATYQYADDKLHKCSVTCTVCYNKWYYGEAHIWSGTATCTSGRTCTVCGGSSEPLGHDWGTWTQNSDEKTHTESVSVTPAIRKPRIATAARRPAPKEQHAQFAVRNMAMLWDMILLPVGHMMITSTGSSVPVAIKG